MAGHSINGGVHHEKTAAEVSEQHKQRNEAWLQRDAEGYMSFYWNDALLFYDKSFLTVSELREHVVSVIEAGGGAVTLDIGLPNHMAISPDGDAVTTSFAWRQRVMTLDGGEADEALHETDVWYCRDGIWKIIAFHISILND